jgi:hypothetical protein
MVDAKKDISEYNNDELNKILKEKTFHSSS